MDSILRILDANLNRVREGWRVMEDAARFHLNSGELSAKIKDLRHGLREAVKAAHLDEAMLQAGRDTAGDVGTGNKTATEFSRGSLRDMVVAAGKRVGEALRAIEESVKIRAFGPRGEAAMPGAAAMGPPPSERFEKLRYRHYDVEKAMVLAMGAAKACPQWRLCVIISEKLCRRPWQEVARLAKAGGADCLQLREKEMRDAELLRRAREFVEIAHERTPVSVFDPDPEAQPGEMAHAIINDRPDIALLCGADGVHVGRQDLPIRSVRQIVGERMWVGFSTHYLSEAAQARDEGADYCGVGAMFATSTKAEVVTGPAYLRTYLDANPHIPHLAIGGITPQNLPELIRAGARGIAVSSVVCGAEEPGMVCRELRRMMDEAAGSGR